MLNCTGIILVIWTQFYSICYPVCYSSKIEINLSIVVWLPIHLPVTTDLKARLCPTNSQSSPFLMTPLSKVPVTTVPLPERGMNEYTFNKWCWRETWLDNSRKIRTETEVLTADGTRGQALYARDSGILSLCFIYCHVFIRKHLSEVHSGRAWIYPCSTSEWCHFK